jgi:hypothetical protein
VIGIVTTHDGAVVSIGHTLAEPPHWVICFYGLPAKQDLTLWVYESPRAGRPTRILYQVQNFSTSSEVFDQVTITSPASGATVSTTFSASGTADVSGDVSADFDGTAGTYPGTLLQGPPNWVVQFTNVQPAQNDYTLNVSVGGTAAQPHTQITVQ